MTDGPRVLATLEGYAVEGGLDGPGDPATCYRATIALGRHEGPGAAAGLWHDYERVLDLVPELGLAGVRLTVEWARVEPRPGLVDDEALDRYAVVAAHARSLGLSVTVALVDRVWPSWLGLEAWLLPWVEPCFIEHARRVVTRLADNVTGVVPFAEPDLMVAAGFLLGSAPPWRRRAREDARSASAQIARLEKGLRGEPVIAPLLVSSSATIALGSPSAVADQRRGAAHCAEVYVRTLVRGAGPTSAPSGLLVRRGDAWEVAADAELLGALR